MARKALLFLMAASMASAVDVSLLKTSKDPQVLMRTAVSCAQSHDQNEWNALLDALGSAQFLSRLDDKDDYLGRATNLRLAKVLAALKDNAAAHPTLVALTTKPAFTSFEPRQDLLIRALSVVRPAPEGALRFWEKHSTPDSPYLHVTMGALADNLSEPALSLMEKRFLEPKFEQADKIAWMRDPVLRHRTDLPMLQFCERLLGKLPAALRPQLVEALCDYSPKWYLSEHPPHPPDGKTASPEAKAELHKICEMALKDVKLTPAQSAAVKRTLAETAK